MAKRTITVMIECDGVTIVTNQRLGQLISNAAQALKPIMRDGETCDPFHLDDQELLDWLTTQDEWEDE